MGGNMAGNDRQAARIVSITLKVMTADGKSRDIEIDPNEHDSFFWSPEAVAKFALPFYAATDSLERAVTIRREVDDALAATGLSLITHKRLCTLEVFDLS
jgi:hypothetical protein